MSFSPALSLWHSLSGTLSMYIYIYISIYTLTYLRGVQKKD